MTRILRHQTEDGFVYYEGITQHGHILTFSMLDLVAQLLSIYKIDLTKHLFNPCKN